VVGCLFAAEGILGVVLLDSTCWQDGLCFNGIKVVWGLGAAPLQPQTPDDLETFDTAAAAGRWYKLAFGYVWHLAALVIHSSCSCSKMQQREQQRQQCTP